MPENKNLKPTNFPMELKFDKQPKTKFKNNINSLKVKLYQAPSMEDLRNYVVDFATATWEDKPIHSNNLTETEKDRLIWLLFNKRLLPSALETIKLNFCFENVSYQDLTHILRYRTATFSVECSGDKWWTDKNCLVPTSIQNSPEFDDRYKKIVNDSKQLYCDMLNSRKVSLLDARYILTRGLETYCWCSISLSDVLNLINHRIDKQIQPDSDNVLAYRIIQCLIKQYPLLSLLLDIHKPSMFYINTARTGRSTNLFVPDKDSDIYEWNKDDYVYKTTRDNVNGTDEKLAKVNRPFKIIMNEVDFDITRIRFECEQKYGKEFFVIDKTE